MHYLHTHTNALFAFDDSSNLPVRLEWRCFSSVLTLTANLLLLKIT